MHRPPTILNRPHMAVDSEFTQFRDDLPLLVGEQEPGKMVQVFMVVRCYSCETFQVQQVKKTNKWCCKVCNEKQSVIKTYGKGLAADCRKHVQKLNLMRADKDQNDIAQFQNNHPPEDYASTFTTEGVHPQQGEPEMPDHPVLLAGKSAGKSKWTTFTEPEEEEVEDSLDDGGEVFTTEREIYNLGQKPRKHIKRSESDRGPRPQLLASSASNSRGSAEIVYPYSSVSQEMESHIDDHKARVTSSNYTLPNDRYRKLNEDLTDFQSTSLQDLTSTSTSGLSLSNHKEHIAKIKEDISRYSYINDDCNGGVRGSEFQAAEEGRGEQIIPKVSSKWSQFMCEEESDDEDNYFETLATGQVLASGLAVARFAAYNELNSGKTEKC